jgi:hypothetical protein
MQTNRPSKNPEYRNPWEINNDRKAEEEKRNKEKALAPPPVAPAARRKTAGGAFEDSRLATARIAEQNRREALKVAAAQPKYIQVELSDQDQIAVVAAWVVRHRDATKPDFLYESDFNLSQLSNAMKRSVSQGKVKWDSAGLDRIHGILIRDGYYESRHRIRGAMPAPKQIPQIEPPTEPGIQVDNAVEPGLAVAECKAMPLEELGKLVRAGYRNPGNKVVLPFV